jgi:hypothetical protein
MDLIVHIESEAAFHAAYHGIVKVVPGVVAVGLPVLAVPFIPSLGFERRFIAAIDVEIGGKI